jgi:anti-sigma factor RsiW
MKSFHDDCILIENSLALWVGGDLEPELCQRVDQHISQCARCAVQARSLEGARQALISGLRAVGPQDLRHAGGPDLWPSLSETLRREGRFTSGPGEISVASAGPDSGPGARPLSLAAQRRGPRRMARLGLAAAAAVMLGFLLGRLGSDVAPVGDPEVHPPVGSGVPDDVAALPKPAASVVPVADNCQLRRLAPGEPRLSDSAQNFGVDWYINNPGQFGNSNVGSPASLQNVQPRR